MTLPRLSLIWRVVIVTGLMGALVLGTSCLALIGNARSAIATEVSSGQKLARDYVVAAVGSLLRNNSPEDAVRFLPGTLFQPRHVRIAVIDHVQGITHFPRPGGAQEEEEAPDWFRALLAPEERELRLPISVGADRFGTVIIMTDPKDEIDEIWDDMRLLGLIGAVAYCSTLLILTFVLRLTLRPLRRMGQTFERLETGDFTARVGAVGTPELAALARRFDRLAEAVERALNDKDQLNRRLVELQDAERKAVAMELHDEFGPCLFGLRVEARSILSEAERLGNPTLAERGQSILDIVEQIQVTNRSLLDRLRPVEMGQLPLSALLEDLVERLASLSEHLVWTVSITNRFDEQASDTVSLTLYRLIQETVTNVLRHARAGRISIVLEPDPRVTGRALLTVEDDGVGWKGMYGSGIRGMRERVTTSGGTFEIGPAKASGERGGTRIQAWLPVLSVTVAEEVEA